MGLQKGSLALSFTADHQMLGGEEAWDCPQCRGSFQVLEHLHSRMFSYELDNWHAQAATCHYRKKRSGLHTLHLST